MTRKMLRPIVSTGQRRYKKSECRVSLKLLHPTCYRNIPAFVKSPGQTVRDEKRRKIPKVFRMPYGMETAIMAFEII